MLTRAFTTAAALSAAILLTGTATVAAAETFPSNHCTSRIEALKATMAERPVLGRDTRGLVERNAALGVYLHQQGKHAQAYDYLGFALGKASVPGA